jgi:hypothetical protein
MTKRLWRKQKKPPLSVKHPAGRVGWVGLSGEVGGAKGRVLIIW